MSGCMILDFDFGVHKSRPTSLLSPATSHLLPATFLLPPVTSTPGSGSPEVRHLAPSSLLAHPVDVLKLDLRWVDKEEVRVGGGGEAQCTI